MSKTAFLVAGLAFGDEGKGSSVDYLVREYGADLVVRYNSGPQAAHCVVNEYQKSHIFSQLGAGSMVDGVRTYLSEYVFIDPIALIREDEILQEQGFSSRLPNVYVNSQSPIITPFHQAINRLREIVRGEKAHGSCGVGFGETVGDSIFYPNLTLRAGELLNKDRYIAKLKKVQGFKQTVATRMYLDRKTKNITAETDRFWAAIFDRDLVNKIITWYEEFVKKITIIPNAKNLITGNTVFEGAQGILLDESRGFAPHVTWADLTFRNANRILKNVGWKGETKKFGVLRSYLTRHGNGPFPTEDKELTQCTPDTYNTTNNWQGNFRCGYLDIPLLKYASQNIGKLDGLFLNHCDVLENREKWPICYAYKNPEYYSLFNIARNKSAREQTRFIKTCNPLYMSLPSETIPKLLASTFRTKLFVKSYGPKYSDKKRVDNSEKPAKVEAAK
jgi:adenylosuccinate synthase